MLKKVIIILISVLFLSSVSYGVHWYYMTQFHYEDCNSISDWTTNGWSVTLGSCAAKKTGDWMTYDFGFASYNYSYMNLTWDFSLSCIGGIGATIRCYLDYDGGGTASCGTASSVIGSGTKKETVAISPNSNVSLRFLMTEAGCGRGSYYKVDNIYWEGWDDECLCYNRQDCNINASKCPYTEHETQWYGSNITIFGNKGDTFTFNHTWYNWQKLTMGVSFIFNQTVFDTPSGDG